MSLPLGSRLGVYELLTLLGAGGMGEVYRACDTRLGRTVAIKVLPADRLADDHRRRRFLHEARTLSTLNHPHIVAIHEIESDGDIDFMVMEFVGGTSLDALIPRHGLSLNELLRIAIPMADALATAHARGIVHRDLKPANVMVGDDGVVKMLDFGLAKLVEEEETSGSDTANDLGQVALTAVGRIAGTAAYMSPEQATGGKVDARSDIFSFGATLYEMATGTRAFPGKSIAETIAAVLQAQPKLPTQISASLPHELERLILRCLRREPERRYQAMLDVRNELIEIREERGSHSRAPTIAALWPHRRALAVLVGALAIAAATRVFWPQRVELPPIRVLPVAIQAGYEMMPTLSPDGEQVAFAWNGDKGAHNFDIYVSLIGSPAVRRITADPAFDVNPSWSPDGRQIALVRYRLTDRSGRVYVTTPLGGGERRLSDFPVTIDDDPIAGPFGQLSWSPDGRYIAAARAIGARGSTGVYLLPTHGGEPRLLTQCKAPATHRDPAFSPNGRRLAYLSCSNCCYAACDVVVVDLDDDFRPTSAPRRLTSLATQMAGLAWTPDGRSLVYGAQTFYSHHLWRVGSDDDRPPERLEVAGLGARRPAIVPARNRLVFDRRTHDPDIYRFSLTAPPRATIVSSFADFNASFSPDGTRIVYASTRSGDSGDIWVAAADGSGPQRLTGDMAGAHAAPQWSPDGHVIAFASRGADGQTQIWTVDADGGNRRQITTGRGDHLYPSWSRDGASIYFTKVDSAGSNIWRVAALGGRDVQVTREGGYMGFESPDGKSLVYRPRWDRNGTPLLTVPLGGGATRQLVKCMYGFSVGSKDVFYYPCRTETFAWTMTMFEPLDLRAIDPVTGLDRLLGSVGGVADRFWGPSVSPDGTEMLYAKAANEGQDLMVIENFR